MGLVEAVFRSSQPYSLSHRPATRVTGAIALQDDPKTDFGIEKE